MPKIPRAWCHDKTLHNIWDLSVPMFSTPSSSPEISQTSDRNCNFKHWTIHIIEAFYALYWHSSVNWNISLSYKLVFVYHSTHNGISVLFNDRKLRKEAYGCYCVFHCLLSCMLLINKSYVMNYMIIFMMTKW